MVQQMAVFEQGCKLMVSVDHSLQAHKVTSLDRTQVRIHHTFHDSSLI